jgi:hypothetical protein
MTLANTADGGTLHFGCEISLYCSKINRAPPRRAGRRRGGYPRKVATGGKASRALWLLRFGAGPVSQERPAQIGCDQSTSRNPRLRGSGETGT